ncbi:MAG: substrate-binding domain-containing protein [Isosphaeraceae bacterium]
MREGHLTDDAATRRADRRAIKHHGWLPALILGCGWLTAGCDSATFLPPRPAALRSGNASGSGVGAGTAGTRAGASSSSARIIEVIAGPLDQTTSEAVHKLARFQAGLDAELVDIKVAGEEGDPRAVSALVKAAVARNPLALVLYFLDEQEPEMARAIADARGQGVPVIVIAGSKAGLPSAPAEKTGKKPVSGTTLGRLIHVVPESLKVAVESVVAAAIRNARNAKLKPDGGAVLLINTASDPLVEDRAQALRDALKSQGVQAVEEIRFPGDVNLALSKVVELMRANRKPVIILSADHVGLTASFHAMEELRDQRPYVVAGFTHDESGGNMTKIGEFAAIAIFSPNRLLRGALSVADALARGEAVRDRVEIPVPAILSPDDSTTGKMYLKNQDHVIKSMLK